MRSRLIIPVLLITSFALLLALGCGDDDDRPGLGPGNTTPPPELTGSWEWVISVGGIAGTTLTPSSLGFSESLVFGHDWTFQHYRADTLIVESQYSVTEGDDLIIRYERSMFPFDEQAVIELSDTLVLEDLCLDCFRRTFTRK